MVLISDFDLKPPPTPCSRPPPYFEPTLLYCLFKVRIPDSGQWCMECPTLQDVPINSSPPGLGANL